MAPSVFLVRRVLPTIIALALACGLVYPFIELSPMDVFYKTFLPNIYPETDIHPSYASAIDLPASHLPKDTNGHPVRAGLLHVNLDLPAEEHPIYQLIRQAKKNWVAKNARQSRTLAEAVRDYKRRNSGRNPPLGFDKWWDWREKNNVQLPDEYDRVNIDMEPFRGFSPQELKKRISHLQTLRDTFSITNTNGKLIMHHRKYDSALKGANERAQGQFDFIKDVAHLMPNFEAVFAIHDTPTQFISHAHLMELKTAVDEGEYFSEEEGDRAFSNWGAACPPDTALYNISIDEVVHPATFDPTWTDDLNDHFDYIAPGWKPFQASHPSDLLPPPHPVPGAKKSFVASHDAMLNLCDHPHLVRLHGALNGLHPVPSPQLLPIFSLSKTNLHSDIMTIPIEQWGEDAGALHWNEKEQGRLLWRGRNTGGYYTDKTPWRSSHRARIARMADYGIDSSVEIIPPPKWLSSYVPPPLNETVSSKDILGTLADYDENAPIPKPMSANDIAAEKLAQSKAQKGGKPVKVETKPVKGAPAPAKVDKPVKEVQEPAKEVQKPVQKPPVKVEKPKPAPPAKVVKPAPDDGGRAAELAAEAAEMRLRRRDGEMHLGDVIINLNQGGLNRKLFDIGLAYEPIQCSNEDGSCAAIKAELPFREVKTFDQENHYRYILDIDGNAWSARFHRLLQSNALILKNTIYPEWWNDRIEPWLHYVPVKLDFTDLYDIMTFFRGDGAALDGEELMARAIAENGRDWALKFWRREDMTAYVWRLYLEWARLLQKDPSKRDFILDDVET